MTRLFRLSVTTVGLLAAWWLLVWLTEAPPFMLPDPTRVIGVLVERFWSILPHAGITGVEILIGLALGTILGGASALLLVSVAPVRRWLMPLLVVSQALPVFALAPLLTLWFGYGLASKIAMATLIIFFPVTAAFYDGLRRIDPGWLDLAQVMGGSRATTLLHLRLPAALPAFGSGLRVATAVAPIGAVVGEWVGSSAGLGYLMLHANGRMQTDLMFAALLVLAVMALTLYAAVDAGARALTRWQPEDGYA